MKDEFYVWITKYAFTSGIEKVLVRGLDQENIVERIKQEGEWHTTYYHAGEWFRSREEALADAEKKRQRKISSLRKQIVKLGKMTFEAAE